MIRFGIISEIKPDAGTVRVKFTEDNLVSDWIPYIQQKTKDDQFYTMPDVNEHVACMMDERLESGVVLGAIYSTNSAPGDVKGKDVTGVKFKDGTVIKYDRAAHKLTIETTGDVDITASSLKLTGNLEVTGNIDATGGVTAVGDVKAGAVGGPLGVGLLTHLHPTPSGPSSPPVNPS